MRDQPDCENCYFAIFNFILLVFPLAIYPSRLLMNFGLIFICECSAIGTRVKVKRGTLLKKGVVNPFNIEGLTLIKINIIIKINMKLINNNKIIQYISTFL